MEQLCYKYDYLLLSTLDIQATCFKLLQKDNVIDPSLTLKQCFRQYINPNTIDFDDPRIWEKLYNNEVLSVFQWDAPSGRRGILAAKPHNLFELTCLNGLIRLMTSEDTEDQIERFCRIKANPESFEEEMIEAGLNEEQRRYMHEELDKYNGCAATQESFMILSQKLAHYTLKQADALRKTVAKKKMSEITFQKELFYKQCDGTQKVKDYLWSVVIASSLGYSFSLNHALPYSIIGVQCILMGGILFPPIYWQAACLLQRSGALDGKSADYNKIAKAVAMLSKQGVKIAPLDINKSEKEFRVDAENNIIWFGFLGAKGLKEKAIDSILENRPFVSFQDYMERSNADITSTVALIKGGAFDSFDARTNIAEELAQYRAGFKEKLNGQNLLMLAKMELWPKDTDELEMSRRVFAATQYMKNTPIDSLIKEGLTENEIKEYYALDNKSITFLDEIGYEHNGKYINKKEWKSCVFDGWMIPIKNYLKDNQEAMLGKVNGVLEAQFMEKYFPGDNISQWEIEILGLCFGNHPMKDVIGITDFNTLPSEPQVDSIIYTKTGHHIPVYNLTMIAGIVIAKDKLHSSITLLTPTGPVEVKFRKEQFANYDAQISKMINGKKTIIERSWLNRGVSLIVHGMRQDDQFVAKTYKKSPMKHTAYKITAILPTGKCQIQRERLSGKAEEDDESR